MTHRQFQIFITTQALLVVLGIGQAAQAGVVIPASSRVSGIVVGSGLKGFFYDRDDPPDVINSLAVADDIIASSSPSATFSSTLVDYPNGNDDILFVPTLGELLHDDAASLNPPGAADSVASPMVMRFMGVINVTEDFDIDPNNSTIDVRFALGSDDGSRLRIGGQTLISIDGTGVFLNFPPEQIEVANFEAPGLYPIEIVWYDHFGGIGIEWYSSISGGPDSGAPAGTAGIVPTTVLGALEQTPITEQTVILVPNHSVYRVTIDGERGGRQQAPFGSGGGCPLQTTVNSSWPVDTQIVLRKSFPLPTSASNLRVLLSVDNDVQVFLNDNEITPGTVIHEGCPIVDEFLFTAPDSLLIAGTNRLVIQATDRGVESYLDLRVLVDMP